MNNTNSGHAKNVANLSKLNQVIAGLGNAYNPANTSINNRALVSLQAEAEKQLAAVDNALADWRNATNAREIAFGGIRQLATRMLSALGSFPVPQQTLDDFAALVKTMRSKVKLSKADAGKTLPDATSSQTEEKATSTSKQSFDAIEEVFGHMVLLLDKEPLYAANEADLSKVGLKSKLEELRQLNANANNSYTLLKAARIARNQFFYKDGNGMLSSIRQVKNYVKGLYGANSQTYKSLANIRFVRVVPAKKAN